jgi:hypothetical protein
LQCRSRGRFIDHSSSGCYDRQESELSWKSQPRNTAIQHEWIASRHSHDMDKPGGNIMKRPLSALALAGILATATIATPTSAHAYWRGWGWGLGGLALGLTIAALARPAYAYYPAYSYGYPAYSYGYGYPAYSYASYGYGYPAYSYGYGYGGYYRAYYRPAFYGGYRVARRVAIHRARWR